MIRRPSRTRRFPARCGIACVVALTTLVMAGCNTDGGGLPGFGTPRLSPPPVAMNGRWTLASPGRGQCAMNFGGAPNATEGTIAPEGGCPGQFYTSRKWTYEDGLIIRNHNNEPLAKLSAADGRFAGEATGGEAITLVR